MLDEKKTSINIMHYFFHQITINMYLRDQNMIQQNEEFAVRKYYFGLIIKEIK